MELIVSGGWFGKEHLIHFPIRGVIELKDLSLLRDEDGFLILSYDFTPKTLGLPIKSSGLPPALLLKLGQPTEIPMPDTKAHIPLKLTGSSLSREGFLKGVEKIKNYILSGDVYQVNLTNRFDFESSESPAKLFKVFISRQLVPYGFCADLKEFFIISGSMELFLKKRGEHIESRPIKGTGTNPEHILKSPKERAENLMITDMVRNDIGIIAQTGSVSVWELFKVESYKTLYQMHSTVVGKTRESIDRILQATFPPASVTGAPKYRAVQVIDELEPHARGYYCGTAGFIYKNGDFTLSVLIRTAFGGGSKLSYFAGCGIVWDSDPEKEWEELLLKIKAFYPQVHP